jgi:hypothetical protein
MSRIDPRTLLVTLALAICAGPAAGAGRQAPVRAFDEAAWHALVAHSPAGRIVVFTTSDCVYCAGEVDALAAAVRSWPAPRPTLSVVVMDGRASARALLGDGLFRTADEVWAFDGDDTVMRYHIDPAWRGETPYIGLLPATGSPWFVLGSASRQDLERLRTTRSPTRQPG